MTAPSALYLTWTDPVTGKSLRVLLEEVVRIGANRERNDIVLALPGVEPYHAEVAVIPGGGYELSAVGSSVVTLNDRPVDRQKILPGASFNVGPVAFTVAFAERPAPAATGPASFSYQSREPASKVPAALGTVLAAVGLAALGASYFVIAPYLRERKSAAPTPDLAAGRPAVPTPTATPPPGDPFREVKKSVVTVIGKLAFRPGFATGTGLFVDPVGKVVTNYHVVMKTDYQQIILPGSKNPIDARIIGYDEDLDLALLQAYVRPPVPVAPMEYKAAAKMGDAVFALGSPSGPTLEVSLSRGIISSDTPRRVGRFTMIQHDAAVNPGNSGGPLLDQRGHVIGINTLKVKDTSGISFAIPIEDVRAFVETASN